MFKLNTIKFQNIGRFVKEQDIDLKESGLTAFDGDNNNTGGSSGAGKSTVANAFDYLFGCNDIPATNLQSRLTKESVWVSGVGDWNEKVVVIVRNKKTGLEIKINEKVFQKEAAEAKLDEILGINRKLFKRIIHKKQKEGGYFLSLTNAKASEFLIECLNLGDIEKKIDQASKKTKEIEAGLIEIKVNKDKYQELIEENELAKKQISHPGKKPDSKRISELSLKIKELKSKAELTGEQSQKELNELLKKRPEESECELSDVLATEAHLKQLEEFKQKTFKIESKIESILNKQKEQRILLQREIKKASDKIMEFTAIESDIERSETKAIALKREIDHFIIDKCPTCLQDWDAVNLKETKIKELNDSIILIKEQQNLLKSKDSAEKNLERLEAVREKIDTTPEEILELRSAQEEFRQKSADLNSKIKNADELLRSEHRVKVAEFEKKVQEKTLEFNKKQQDIKNQITLLQSEHTSLKEKTNTYEILLTQYDNQLKMCIKNIEKHKKTKEKLTQEILEKEKKANIESETSRALKLYLLEVFEDTLMEIGERATQLVCRIPNMSSATIEYRGEKENKKGTIKKEICPYVTLDGETIPLKTLSGGERCSIDLAVDFAVEEVIEARAGVGASWKILDEPFDGLDSVCKEQCLELISHLAENKKVFIVDHSSETKEIFKNVITIEREGLYSNIVKF